MVNKIQKNKGITLIALVITIIVMLILVAVTINIAINGGLFDYAKVASSKTEKAKEDELKKAALDANLTIDEIISKYNTQEVTNPYENEEWTYAWTCTNESWSNTISYTAENDANLSGDIVAKLYEKGTVIPEGEEEGTAYHIVIEKIGTKGEMGELEEGRTRTSFAWRKTNSINKYITKAIICDGISNVAPMAFNNCISLTSVSMPNGIETIGYWAFSKTGITGVTIPNTVTTIQNDAFNRCTKLESIIIPNSVTTIQCNTFEHCSSLTRVVLPNNLTSLDGIFGYCTALTNITIPETVNQISSYNFMRLYIIREYNHPRWCISIVLEYIF